MKYFIREFAEKDVNSIIKLYQEVFAEPPWNENWNYEDVLKEINCFLSKKNPIFIVAEADSKIIGFRIAYELDLSEFEFLRGLLKDGEAIYGKELAVKRDYREFGIGTNMMLLSFDIAREKGYRKFIGRTNVESKMVPLYKKLGYINTNIKDPQYPERVYFVKLM